MMMSYLVRLIVFFSFTDTRGKVDFDRLDQLLDKRLEVCRRTYILWFHTGEGTFIPWPTLLQRSALGTLFPPPKKTIVHCSNSSPPINSSL